MDISTFDIILLFILSIVMSMLIGYNIMYIIDKKISNVNINIPPIRVPKPTVSVKINRVGDDYDVYVDKSFENTKNKKTNVNNEKKIEPKKDSRPNVVPTIKPKVTVPNSKQEMDVVEPFGNYAAANIKKR